MIWAISHTAQLPPICELHINQLIDVELGETKQGERTPHPYYASSFGRGGCFVFVHRQDGPSPPTRTRSGLGQRYGHGLTYATELTVRGYLRLCRVHMDLIK